MITECVISVCGFYFMILYGSRCTLYDVENNNISYTIIHVYFLTVYVSKSSSTSAGDAIAITYRPGFSRLAVVAIRSRVSRRPVRSLGSGVPSGAGYSRSPSGPRQSRRASGSRVPVISIRSWMPASHSHPSVVIKTTKSRYEIAR